MTYKFGCSVCNTEFDLDIPIEKYTDLKDKQKCPYCKNKLKRIIEWSGVATGSGSGWFGKSDGGKTI